MILRTRNTLTSSMHGEHNAERMALVHVRGSLNVPNVLSDISLVFWDVINNDGYLDSNGNTYKFYNENISAFAYQFAQQAIKRNQGAHVESIELPQVSPRRGRDTIGPRCSQKYTTLWKWPISGIQCCFSHLYISAYHHPL